MKTWLTILFLCFAVQANAAGTCVLTQGGSFPGAAKRWLQYTCTADAADATIGNTTITGFRDYYLYSVETWPGATAPTDVSDLTLSDSDSEDLLAGNGTDGIDATDKNTILPESAYMGLKFFHMIKGNLTLAISGNAVNSAIINVRVVGVK